ncbi:MAG TPA: glycosyltransferase [Candidatus Kapabacteria bacterium]|nr:glycosyltransferase [Candidatus Kapabacteria bacterium]
MTVVIVLLSLLVVLNVVTFVLSYKRTKRLFLRYCEPINQRLDGAFRRIESRLVHGVSDFENTAGTHSTWAVMFTYDRKEMAAHTLKTLRKYEPGLPILVIDNGSKDGTPEMLTQMLREGTIQKALFNTHEDVPQWQKSFALKQALKLLAMEYPSYLVWLDDDLEITRPFLAEGIALLDTLRDERVKVINMTDSEVEERNHPTIKRVPIMVSGVSEEIKLRPTFNGQFDLFSTEFFREAGYPPIAEGITDWGVEDWFYSRRLAALDYRAAVYVAAIHLGVISKREEKTIPV